jgi:hypothetical protein
LVHKGVDAPNHAVFFGFFFDPAPEAINPASTTGMLPRATKGADRSRLPAVATSLRTPLPPLGPVDNVAPADVKVSPAHGSPPASPPAPSRPDLFVVVGTGVDPVTSRFSGARSTN